MIELKTYKITQEFFPLLGITQSQWNRRREELISHLEDYYDFELDLKSCPKTITITKIWNENYEPLPRKNQVGYKNKLNDYDEYTESSLLQKPYNTAANLGRNAYELQEKYNHKPSTSSKYCANALKNPKYNQTNEKKWVKIVDNDYIPLTPTEEKYLDNLRRDHLDDNKFNLALIAEIQQGTAANPEESWEYIKQNLISNWLEIKKEFKIQFGYYPIAVSKWEVSKF